MSRPTQVQRVLRALEQRGERGVSQADFAAVPTIDFHPPIWRVPARIDDLRRRGHAIETRRVRTAHGAHIAVYVLVTRVGPHPDGANPSPAPAPVPLVLDLGGTVTRRPANPYQAEVG